MRVFCEGRVKNPRQGINLAINFAVASCKETFPGCKLQLPVCLYHLLFLSRRS